MISEDEKKKDEFSNGVNLSQKHCVPCEGGMQPMTEMEATAMLTHVQGWTLASDAKKITKQFKFKDFVAAMDFANKITPVAETEGHHPDLSISWGKVFVELTTHAVKGLSENDFILAAKIDHIS